MRKINYGAALREALDQMMSADPGVFLIGQGVNSPWYVGDTTRGLFEKYGKKRIVDCPVSENLITGLGIGAAMSGLKPVVIHPRMDFMLLAFEPIISQAANWHYMFGGEVSVPVTVRSIINRGGEQACQHAQALQAMLMHVPGLKVVMPASAYDAKGLLISSILDPNPVLYIDDRWLYSEESDVPEEIYEVPIGKGVIRREGNDVTLVAISYLVPQALRAAEILAEQGIDVEVIDPRSLKPLDTDLIFQSVRKTGRLAVADSGWLTGGASAEIAARAAEHVFGALKAPVVRIALPDVPAPASKPLEDKYFIKSNDLVNAILKMMSGAVHYG